MMGGGVPATATAAAPWTLPTSRTLSKGHERPVARQRGHIEEEDKGMRGGMEEQQSQLDLLAGCSCVIIM